MRTITNHWTDETRRLTPPVDHVRVYQAAPGSAYNHHPHIASAYGKLYATWSSGAKDEDRGGQHVLLCVSDDFGRSWSEPRELARTGRARFGADVLTNNGILRTSDSLIAFVGRYDVTEYSQLMYYAAGGNTVIPKATEPFYESAWTDLLISHDEGASWHPTNTRLPDSVLNLCPSGTPTGRLIYPGHVRFWYTDDSDALLGWKPTGPAGLPVHYQETPAGFDTLKGIADWPMIPHEASWYSTPSGSLHMMYRTYAGRLAVSRSEDDGTRWTAPQWTEFSDCGSRMHFGNLPDGRAFALSTPQPGSPRTPLVFAVSEDGFSFGMNYILGDDENFLAWLPGMHKYGRYGYPYFCYHEGLGYAIYSVNKEQIWIARFDLSGMEGSPQ